MEASRSQEPDLLGYVFDALDSAEQSVIESRMEVDESVCLEISRLYRTVLTPLGTDDPILPPLGLADRTLAAIGIPAMSPSEFIPSQSGSFASARDVLVAVGALALLAALFFPALGQLHREGDRLARTDALRRFGSEWHADSLSPSVSGDFSSLGGYSEAMLLTSLLHQATQLLPSASVILEPISGAAKNYGPALTDFMKPPTATFVHYVSSHSSAGLAGFYPKGKSGSVAHTSIAADPFHPVDLTDRLSAEPVTGNVLFADGHVAWVDR